MKGGPALHLDRVVRVVGQDKDRATVRRDVTPPPPPIRVTPLAANRAEHVAAHDRCPHAVHHVRDHLPVHWLVVGGAEVPLVKRFAADTERVLLTLVCSEAFRVTTWG